MISREGGGGGGGAAHWAQIKNECGSSSSCSRQASYVPVGDVAVTLRDFSTAH